ncbi:MAG: NUDIX hydrolase, partial [Chloroflexota bacterium]
MYGIGTSGVLVNQFNQVLLIQRDDTRTWAPPGGSLDPNELPTDGVAREVKEETGILVMPVRLTAVHYIPFKPRPLIGFTFRCIQRGGELTTSEESPQVGYFKPDEFPKAMADFHQKRLSHTLAHQSPQADWYTHPLSWQNRITRFLLMRVVYPLKDWQRKRQGRPLYVAPPAWETSAFTVIQNEQGHVLWVKRTDQDVWNLPGGRAENNESPWETAVRETQEETGLMVELTNLAGVYIYPSDPPHMAFVFKATVQSGTLTQSQESSAFEFIQNGAEPLNSVAQHIERVQDALS